LQRARRTMAAALLCGSAASAQAQADAALRGITTVNVLVQLDQRAVEYGGLDRTALVNRVTGRLLPLGLRVVDIEEGAGRSMSPILLVTIAMSDEETLGHARAYTVHAGLTEGVALRRSAGERVWGETWSAGEAVGFVGPGRPEDIAQAVDRLVARFASAFRSANTART